MLKNVIFSSIILDVLDLKIKCIYSMFFYMYAKGAYQLSFTSVMYLSIYIVFIKIIHRRSQN